MNDRLMLLLNAIVPEGTKKEFELDGVKYKLTKEDGEITIETVETFDDSEVKDTVARYKKLIKELDDDLFVEATEKISETVNLTEFNKLLDLETFNEDQADKVESMIDLFSNTIGELLENKLKRLLKLYEAF